MQIIRNGVPVVLAEGEKPKKRDARISDGWVWAGRNFVSLETWASLVGPNGKFKKSNDARQDGINPLTGEWEVYVGMLKGGKLIYKKSIAKPLGLADEDHAFEKCIEKFAQRRKANSNRKKIVYPRKGISRDPGGLIHEDLVRKYWQSLLEKFEDFTADGMEAIGADFRGYWPELQKTVWIEAQPIAHDLTNNEHLGVCKAAHLSDLYIIHTRRGWFEVVPEDFEEMKAFRLNKRPAL